MTTTKNKKFDCVEFKHKAQAEIYEEIKSLTPRQQIEYFQREANKGPIGKWWKQVQSAASTKRASRTKKCI